MAGGQGLQPPTEHLSNIFATHFCVYFALFSCVEYLHENKMMVLVIYRTEYHTREQALFKLESKLITISERGYINRTITKLELIHHTFPPLKRNVQHLLKLLFLKVLYCNSKSFEQMNEPIQQTQLQVLGGLSALGKQAEKHYSGLFVPPVLFFYSSQSKYLWRSSDSCWVSSFRSLCW